MPTFREAVLSASLLPSPNRLRDHLLNLGSGQVVEGTVIIGGVRLAEKGMALSTTKGESLSCNIDALSITAEKGTALTATLMTDTREAEI